MRVPREGLATKALALLSWTASKQPDYAPAAQVRCPLAQGPCWGCFILGFVRLGHMLSVELKWEKIYIKIKIEVVNFA